MLPFLSPIALTFIHQMLSSKRTRRISSGEVSSDHPLSAAVIAANTDLLLEILLCLPVRSLLVFKSVSKRWLSLISEPYFVDNHILRIRSRPIPRLFVRKVPCLTNPEFEFIFLDGNVTGVPFKSLEFVNDPAGIMIQQSCNGLLCCSDFRPDDYSNNRNNYTYYIYNPSTKHYTTLPRSPNRETIGLYAFTDSESPQDCPVSVCSISLAFDPLKSPHYKAICVLHIEEEAAYDEKEEVYRIDIYSSETASWKLSGDAFSGVGYIFDNSGVFWNGSLHWTSCESDPLCFDVDQELLETLPTPPRPEDLEDWVTMYFGEFNGHLHLIEGYGTQSMAFDILEMETDYSEWNVKYRVDLETLITAYPEMMCRKLDDYRFKFSVVVVVDDEEEKELSSLVLQIPDKVISYDLKEMTFKKVHDSSPGLCVDGSLEYKCSDAHYYIETLARV